MYFWLGLWKDFSKRKKVTWFHSYLFKFCRIHCSESDLGVGCAFFQCHENFALQNLLGAFFFSWLRSRIKMSFGKFIDHLFAVFIYYINVIIFDVYGWFLFFFSKKLRFNICVWIFSRIERFSEICVLRNFFIMSYEWNWHDVIYHMVNLKY